MFTIEFPQAISPPAEDGWIPSPLYRLTVEVADSSLAADRRMGTEICGPAGIPVYWIVDRIQRQVEVYTEPGPEGYRSCEIFAAGQSVPVVVEGQRLAQIAVIDLLPSRPVTF